jgi:thiamine pyrophosphokinase
VDNCYSRCGNASLAPESQKGHNVKSHWKKHCLIILDGEISSPPIKQFIKKVNPIVIFADGASNQLYKLKIKPDFIIGDLDSVSAGVLKFYKRKNTTVIQITEQEHNDFEKCIMFALSNKLKNLTVMGYGGKRIDHMLNNFSVMKRYYKKCNIRFADDEFEIFFVRKSVVFPCHKGSDISLIAMPKATGVKTYGLKYMLNNETLEFGKRQGTLNKAVGNKVKIEVKKGDLMVVRRLPVRAKIRSRGKN